MLVCVVILGNGLIFGQLLYLLFFYFFIFFYWYQFYILFGQVLRAPFFELHPSSIRFKHFQNWVRIVCPNFFLRAAINMKNWKMIDEKFDNLNKNQHGEK